MFKVTLIRQSSDSRFIKIAWQSSRPSVDFVTCGNITVVYPRFIYTSVRYIYYSFPYQGLKDIKYSRKFAISVFVIIKFSFIFNKPVSLPESVKARSSPRSEVGAHSSHSCEYIGRHPDCKTSKTRDKTNYFFKIISKLFSMCLTVPSNHDSFFFIPLGIPVQPEQQWSDWSSFAPIQGSPSVKPRITACKAPLGVWPQSAGSPIRI